MKSSHKYLTFLAVWALMAVFVQPSAWAMGWLPFWSADEAEIVNADQNAVKPDGSKVQTKDSYNTTAAQEGRATANVNPEAIKAKPGQFQPKVLTENAKRVGQWSGSATLDAISPNAVTDPTEIFLRADTTTKTMPDGREVVMWGFAQDSSFGAEDGEVQVPGPPIEVQSENASLTIHLDNNLSVPVSIVLTGHIEEGGMTPAYMGNGRVRAFTHEAAPGNTSPEDYIWTVRKGTYFYHSGSHPQVQVQMGLYGAVSRLHDATHAYPDTPAITGEVTLLFSEIDPDLHDAVASGNYGPGTAMTSTIDYAPQYFLINGESFTTDQGFDPELALGLVGEAKLLRLLNVGNFTHQPALLNLRMIQIAEDGNVLPFARDRQVVRLQPLKTVDVIVTPTEAGRYTLLDQRLYLAHGGMLRYLTATE